MVRAKIQFFEDHSISSILTRFSKDQAVVDYILPSLMITVFYAFVRSFGIAVSIALVNPYCLISVVITVLMMFLFIRRNSKVLQSVQ